MDEQTKKLLDEMSTSVKSYNEVLKGVQELVKAKADQSKIDELIKSNKDTEDKIVTLSKQLDEIQLKQKDQVIKGKVEPWIVTLAKALKGDSFKKAANKQGKFEVTFTTNPYSVLKVAGTMVTDDNLGGLDLDTAVVVPMREPGVSKAPDRPITILDIITKGSTNSNQITWAERTARTEGAAAVAENAVFVASDYHWALKKIPVNKIGTFVKVSNESLEDFEFTLSEINTELISQLERVMEEEVTNGTGANDRLKGITQYAKAYTYAGLNGKITKCNLKDIILAMRTQVSVANFAATHVVLNTADFAEYQSLKDDNGRYLFEVMPGGGKSIAGLPVVEVSTSILAAGYAIVGDFSKDKLYMRREITIEMFDQDSTDAEYDLRMIRGKLRAANRIKVCDEDAFCYDALADVQALIAAV